MNKTTQPVAQPENKPTKKSVSLDELFDICNELFAKMKSMAKSLHVDLKVAEKSCLDFLNDHALPSAGFTDFTCVLARRRKFCILDEKFEGKEVVIDSIESETEIIVIRKEFLKQKIDAVRPAKPTAKATTKKGK